MGVCMQRDAHASQGMTEEGVLLPSHVDHLCEFHTDFSVLALW